MYGLFWSEWFAYMMLVSVVNLLVGFGPVGAGDVPQVSPVLDLVVADLLVLQPHDAVPVLGLI